MTRATPRAIATDILEKWRTRNKIWWRPKLRRVIVFRRLDQPRETWVLVEIDGADRPFIGKSKRLVRDRSDPVLGVKLATRRALEEYVLWNRHHRSITIENVGQEENSRRAAPPAASS